MDHAEKHKTSLPVADASTQIDPVCGMTVPADSPRSAEYNGENYVFCSDGCLKTFQDDPAGVLAKRSQKEASSGSSCCGGGAAVQTRETSNKSSCCGGHSSTKASDSPADTDPIYTCPMHPEIEQVGPGDCPICGMDLEPKVVALDDEGDDKQYADMKLRFWVGVALSVPLLVIAMGPMVGLRVADWMSQNVFG
ncbi:MAG: YHS domain-containing protein, partial [Rubripirellula sp.]